MLYIKGNIKHVTPCMKSYIKNNSLCQRNLLFKNYLMYSEKSVYMDVNVVIFVVKHVYVLNVYLSDKSYIKLTCIYIVFAELHQLQLTYALLNFLH